MPAWEVYRWSLIAPGATVGLYVHGYEWGHVGVYGAQIHVGPGNPTWFAINLTQGINRVHYDSTFAKEAWVQNIGSHSVPVNLYELYEIAQSS
jgi:hypothetical protein